MGTFSKPSCFSSQQLLLKLVNFLHFLAGFEFFQSANGVILCAGDENGRLPAELFAKVVHRKRGKLRFRKFTVVKKLLKKSHFTFGERNFKYEIFAGFFKHCGGT